MRVLFGLRSILQGEIRLREKEEKEKNLQEG